MSHSLSQHNRKAAKPSPLAHSSADVPPSHRHSINAPQQARSQQPQHNSKGRNRAHASDDTSSHASSSHTTTQSQHQSQQSQQAQQPQQPMHSQHSQQLQQEEQQEPLVDINSDPTTPLLSHTDNHQHQQHQSHRRSKSLRQGTFTTESNDVVEWVDTTQHGSGEEGPVSSVRFALRITALSILCVLFGISNNVTFFEMGQRMKDYPVFLLYFTTMAYTFLYFVWAVFNAIFLADRTESLPKYLLGASYQRLFAWLGFWLTVNGLLSQFSDPHVDGNLQSVLYQLTLPATGTLAYFMLRERFSLLNLVGSALVLGGCLMVALPPLLKEEDSHSSNRTTTVAPSIPPAVGVGGDDTASADGGAEWIWIIVFALSVIPNGVCAVIQESLFRDHSHVDTVLLLFWSNFYTLFGYALALPLTMLPYLGHQTAKGIARHERDAFRCLTGSSPLPPGCEQDAFVPVLAFVVSYMGFFYFLAQLVKEVGAVFESLVNGVVTPASAIAFGMRWLVKSDTEPLTGWVISASVIVPLGVLLYKADELKTYLGFGSEGQELQTVHTHKGGRGSTSSSSSSSGGGAADAGFDVGIVPVTDYLESGTHGHHDGDDNTPLLSGQRTGTGSVSAPRSRRLSPASSPLLPLRFGHSTVATLQAALMVDSQSEAARRRSRSFSR
ncbi:hypothetical protein PTSG_00666 [Salpingoeca rosetta]|uniref:Uncharacterized protein n=1 Tax=Salpingoeca rosetta (strain ATCC 50818 / BSB-021) TaxID=946362 RepID=F2TX49_SALR5|nr:uncharacterized protein PTSG_00666 [Salpingoeca rosetta]EGD75958.1 hypothetical protein PTSG_00666 [Salpingoeca rosetta]|eukprot:XP_004998134.1 hypothetical protein PTSG_00666 [Salpingoeca rosetta]